MDILTMRGQNGAKRGQTLDKLNPYGQKIPNACPPSLCSLTGSRSGRLACAHRALRLPALGSAAGRGVGYGGC